MCTYFFFIIRDIYVVSRITPAKSGASTKWVTTIQIILLGSLPLMREVGRGFVAWILIVMLIYPNAVKVDDYCWFVLLPASRDRNIGEKVSKKKWGGGGSIDKNNLLIIHLSLSLSLIEGLPFVTCLDKSWRRDKSGQSWNKAIYGKNNIQCSFNIISCSLSLCRGKLLIKMNPPVNTIQVLVWTLK